MNWTIKTNNSISSLVSYPCFEAERKSEKKAAQRMNRFYEDIISAIEKHSAENEYKYYIDINAEKIDNKINIILSFRARQRGRTIKSFSNEAIWKNGVVINKSKKHT